MKSSKFIGSSADIAALLVEPDFQLVSSEELRTVYYDDDEQRCYHDQFRKTRRRFKVRMRSRNGSSVLEVKLKGGKGDALRQLAADSFDAAASDYVRHCLDDAFETGFAAGIEGRLTPLVETDFTRSTWLWRGETRFAVDSDVRLSCRGRSAALDESLALIELPTADDHRELAALLEAAGGRRIGFSKFGAALDLLQEERVRSHKPGMLQEMFRLV